MRTALLMRSTSSVRAPDRGRMTIVCFGFVTALAAITAGAALIRSGSLAYLLLALIVLGSAALVFATNIYGWLVCWIGVEAIAFPFVRYPLHHNVVTFDRAVILGLGGALLLSPAGRMGPQATRITRAFGLFVVVYGLRAFTTHLLPAAPYHTAVSLLQPKADWLDYAVLPFIACVAAARTITPERWPAVAKAFTLLGVTVAIIGLLEWRIGFHLADLSGFAAFSDVSDAKLGLVRSAGPYSDPSAYGGVLVLCIAATLYWLQAERARFLAGGALMIEVAGLAPSYTKTVWGAGFVVLLVGIGIRRRVSSRSVLVAFYGLVGLAVVYTLVQHSPTVSERLTGSNANFTARLGAYVEGFHIFAHWPWFGVGVENFLSAQQLIAPVTIRGVAAANTAHNTFIHLLAETGVPGLLVLCILIWATVGVIRACNRRLQTEEGAVFAATILAAASGYLLLSLTFTEIYYPPTTTLFALLLGAAASRLDHEGSMIRSTIDEDGTGNTSRAGRHRAEELLVRT